jgi:glycine cleavage system H protein
MSEVQVLGFKVRTDLAYDMVHHLWVAVTNVDRVCRVGMDPLGVDTSGTLAQLVLHQPGMHYLADQAVGSLEAEKYVGPVVTPLSGRVIAINPRLVSDPGVVGKDPYGDGWLFEIELDDPDELAGLVSGEQRVVAGFEQRIRQYRLEGVLAE